MSSWVAKLRPSRLTDLMATEREQRAYQQGIERGRREHECPTPNERPYPKEIVSRLDDVADAAWPKLGDDAYRAVDALHKWLVDREEPHE